MIYLFGGWDGTKDLSDLWSYNISDSKWKLISPDTSADVRLMKQAHAVKVIFQYVILIFRAVLASVLATKW